MTSVRMAVHCQYCDKQKAAHDVMQLPGDARICLNCLDWHRHALSVLAGELPKGCQGCGTSMQRVADFSATPDIKMTLVPKDGIYQVLCEPCAAKYRRKRAGFYKGTKAYWDHRLDGAN